MNRLSGFDAAFIYDERPDEPQHTLKIACWSAKASAGHTLARTRRFVSSRMGALPPLRWKVVRVPFDFHHPVCVDRGMPDLQWHVRGRSLAAPGGRRELCEAISRIASEQLDPSRPLWELWMLDGYEGDKVVAVLKLSHALADGGSSCRLIENLYSADVSAAPAELERESIPAKSQLLRDAVVDLRRGAGGLADLARRSIDVLRRTQRTQREPSYSGPRISLVNSPPTPFGGPLSSRRAFYFTTVPLAQAKEIRSALDCTLNDVLLATAAGAARRYMKSRRALPGLPTIGTMPASIREDDEKNAWGNRITTRPLILPTQLADPIARLSACRQVASDAKADLALRRGANLEDWIALLPPLVPKLFSGAARAFLKIRPETPAGVTVSNVRGPAQPLPVEGGLVHRFISVGHMKYAAGLNVTVWSYAGELTFGLYACAEAMPDLWRFAGQLDESFEELRTAASLEASRVSRETAATETSSASETTTLVGVAA